MTTGAWLGLKTIAGNLLFLQSLPGYIVAAPEENRSLWSLSYEMTYYVLFAASLVFASVRPVWMAAAVICAALPYWRGFDGVAGHFVDIFSLSAPWLLGHLIARHSRRLPPVSIPLGVCFLIIGFVFARCQLSESFYDPFRLCAFGLFSSPLMLAVIQPAEAPFPSQTVVRLAAFAVGATLLWSFSPSLLHAKIVFTAAGLAAAMTPLGIVGASLAALSPLRAPLAYVGSISYALYAVHMPIMFLMNFALPTQTGPRILLFLLASWMLSHLLERALQPRIRSLLRP